MSNDDFVDLEGVEILKKNDWSLSCRIGGRQVTIPSQVVTAPRPLPLAGEVVTLQVTKWFAVDNGLV